MPNSITNTSILIWVVGIIMVSGGGVLGIMKLMIKGKQNKAECVLIHEAVKDRLDDIKGRLEKGDTKIDGMKETLTKISTILEERSKDETQRYDRHSDEWKDK